MARKQAPLAIDAPVEAPSVNLGKLLSRKATWGGFHVWVVGDTPLICHAWSHKAKLEMLSKQVKATKGGKEARNPEQDFVDSLYEMGDRLVDRRAKNIVELKDGVYGFPATGLKKAIMSAAHKDKGVAKTAVLTALFLDADLVSVRPALAGAMCDMPLVRLYASPPQMREDMVKIGSGLNKVASLAYRAQFTTWAIRLSGRLNTDVMPFDALAFILNESGMSSGLGEWRNEKSGMFGAYHLGMESEAMDWERFSRGEGPLPVKRPTFMAAE